jgi:hypothetical protein
VGCKEPVKEQAVNRNLHFMSVKENVGFVAKTSGVLIACLRFWEMGGDLI